MGDRHPGRDEIALQRAMLGHTLKGVPQDRPGAMQWSATAKGVFERMPEDSSGREVSDGAYNLIMGLVLCWGFGVNWLIVEFVPCRVLMELNPLVFLVGYFASCLIGVHLFVSSERPTVSFLGYNLVVVPFGAVVNLVVHRYDPLLVVQAIRLTGCVTATMMVLGALCPAFFRRISSSLALALVFVIVWELADLFIFHVRHGVIDWLVVAIFCGYVGVDWGRANQVPKTVDNAVDSAAALYMDIINLFLRILRIIGRRR